MKWWTISVRRNHGSRLIYLFLASTIWSENAMKEASGILFTFDSAVLPLHRPHWEGWGNFMGTLMLGNVEGTLRGQTGAGGRAGRLDGWVGGWLDEAEQTHLWRGVLEPWSCYGVDIENLFCLGLRRVGFHLGEREWQNIKKNFLVDSQSACLPCPFRSETWECGQVGMVMKGGFIWRQGRRGYLTFTPGTKSQKKTS